MSKFQDKYRIESTRLQNWDYGSIGWYFVTICVKDRADVFGEIEDRVMKLSPLGETVQQYLIEIPDHFPHTALDAFVVMPNHVHAIIIDQGGTSGDIA